MKFILIALAFALYATSLEAAAAKINLRPDLPFAYPRQTDQPLFGLELAVYNAGYDQAYAAWLAGRPKPAPQSSNLGPGYWGA